MSGTTVINDVLKGAQEVTSLASSDRLMAIGPEGGLKRISRDNAVFRGTKAEKDFMDSATRWITIAQASPTAAWGGILTVSQGLWSGHPNLHVFALGGRYDSSGPQRPEIRSLLGAPSGVRLRVVLFDSVIRLDCQGTFRKLEVSSWGRLSLIDPVEAEPVPSGATVWEYSSSSLASGISGGGKSLLFNHLCNNAEGRAA